MSDLAAKGSPVHRLPPLSKLLVTLMYIGITVSFGKYDGIQLFAMVLFPLIGYQASGIPMRTCFYKMRVVLPFVCAVGIFNPFIDRQTIMTIGGFAISGGAVSMLTLMMKGVFCLTASFLLIATTTIEEICFALRQLGLPKMLTSLLMLTYRYIGLLLSEAATMTDAYHLRAPKQKGIRFSAWGSFLGQLILRSIDKAESVYAAMTLRGFCGEFYYAKGNPTSAASWIFVLACGLMFAAFRVYNVPAILGSLAVWSA